MYIYNSRSTIQYDVINKFLEKNPQRYKVCWMWFNHTSHQLNQPMKIKDKCTGVNQHWHRRFSWLASTTVWTVQTPLLKSYVLGSNSLRAPREDCTNHRPSWQARPCLEKINHIYSVISYFPKHITNIGHLLWYDRAINPVINLRLKIEKL